MLVLSRQRNEKHIIAVPPSAEWTFIEHTTVDIRGDKVRHGWDAPDQVTIHREEVYKRIEREKQTRASA